MRVKPIAVRLDLSELAKARDGLLKKGVPSEQLMTRSNILRLSVYLAIDATANPSELPSEESLSIVEGI